MNHDVNVHPAASLPAGSAAAGIINNGKGNQTSNTPQLQVHLTEGDGAASTTSLYTGDSSSYSSNTHPQLHADLLNQHQQSGSSASSPSGSYSQSHLTHPSSTGTSSYTTPSPAAANATLAAPRAVTYNHQPPPPGQGGMPTSMQHAFEGRISPRPVSRNQTRTPQYHSAPYSTDGYARPPGDTRTQLFVGNVSGTSDVQTIVAWANMDCHAIATIQSTLARPERPLSQMWLCIAQ